ncbi:hypothetical protein BSNK01_25510 [Bacillaceae bacterium]
MFFHGINVEYVENEFPVLAPRRSISQKKDAIQIQDRRHLLERFGLEPVHLLESEPGIYPVWRCVKECFRFGDVVFAFPTLPLPFWQLSRHEIGVPVLDLRHCAWLVVSAARAGQRIRRLFPGKRIFIARRIKRSKFPLCFAKNPAN